MTSPSARVARGAPNKRVDRRIEGSIPQVRPSRPHVRPTFVSPREETCDSGISRGATERRKVLDGPQIHYNDARGQRSLHGEPLIGRAICASVQTRGERAGLKDVQPQTVRRPAGDWRDEARRLRGKHRNRRTTANCA